MFKLPNLIFTNIGILSFWSYTVLTAHIDLLLSFLVQSRYTKHLNKLFKNPLELQWRLHEKKVPRMNIMRQEAI